MIYAHNPACQCAWCLNGGVNPLSPDDPDTLGYDIPHIPPPAPPAPRIVALLCWYDEPVDWLKRCVHSLAKLRVTHLVAVDGAYAHYPDAQAESDPAQRQAIAQAAEQAAGDARIPCTITAPAEPWESEIAKRTHMFRLAERITDPTDWYFVIDADEVVLTAPLDLRDHLRATPFDVGAVTLDEPGHPFGTIRYDTFPMFFRAIPGLHVEREHFRYKTPDGRPPWGDARRERLEPRYMTGVHVEHRTQLRNSARRQRALDYYDLRDELGLEPGLAENRRDRSLLKDAA